MDFHCKSFKPEEETDGQKTKTPNHNNQKMGNIVISQSTNT